MPILSVVWIAFHPSENIWGHLMATSLPRYATNTVVVMVSVGTFSAMIGTGAAWLVVMYDFPGKRMLEWALLCPLAVPGYLGAYALVDFLEYAGPVQTALRAAFGWTGRKRLFFFQISDRFMVRSSC